MILFSLISLNFKLEDCKTDFKRGAGPQTQRQTSPIVNLSIVRTNTHQMIGTGNALIQIVRFKILSF